MTIQIDKCYNKDDNEITPDYSITSFPELENLIAEIVSKIETKK